MQLPQSDILSTSVMNRVFTGTVAKSTGLNKERKPMEQYTSIDTVSDKINIIANGMLISDVLNGAQSETNDTQNVLNDVPHYRTKE